MPNSFENKLNELQNFSLEPTQQVWVEIEKQLPQEKRRRIVAWWWSMPVLLFFGWVAWFLFSKEEKKENTSITANKQKEQKNTQIFGKNNPILDQNTSTFDKKIPILDKNTSIFDKNSPVFDMSMAISDKKSKVLGKTLATLNKKQPISNTNSAISIENKLTVCKGYSFPYTDELKLSAANRALDKNDTNEIIVSLPKKHDTITTTKNLDEKSLKPTYTTKKISWSLAVAAGVNYLSRNGLFSPAVSNSYTASSVSSGGIVMPQSGLLSLPKLGFNFTVGVNGNYNLSKKIDLQFGLNYSFLQNSLAVEQIPQNAMNPFDDLYRSGTANTIKNNYHLISIPLKFQFCVNPKSKNKLAFITGGSVEYALAKNWLFVNDDNYYYQKNNDALNTVFAAAHAGFSINFNNKFSVNLLAKKYTTPVQNSSSKYYWQQINMQVGIPLR